MVWLILCLAFFLRLILLNQSLWWDEGITAWVVKNNNLELILTKFISSDFHPPLHYILLNIWGNIFGFSEISLRLPSVILGVITIYLTYLIGKNLFSPKVGLISAILLALSPLHIYYSQEARMYALAAFSTTLSFYCLINFLNGRKLAGLSYIVASTLIFYSNYTAVLVIPAQFLVVGLFFKEKIRKAAKLGFIIVLLSIPGLLILKDQLIYGIETTNNMPEWKSIIGGVGLKEILLLPAKMIVGRIGFDNKLLYGLIVGTLGLVNLVIIKFAIKPLNKITAIILFWLIFPPALALIISLWVPIFAYFRFIFILPAFYLLLALGLSKLKTTVSRLLLILVIIFEIIFTSIYFINPKFHREDWKDAINYVNQEANLQTIVLHKNLMVPLVFNYYQKNQNIATIPAFKRIPAKYFDDLNNLENNLQNYQQVIIINYLTEVTDPTRILEDKLNELQYTPVKEKDIIGVGLIKTYAK